MRPIILLILGCLLTAAGGLNPARAQAPRPAGEPAHTAKSLTELLPAIAARPDSSQVDQLREFSDVMVEAGRFDEATAALDRAATVAQVSGRVRLIAGVELSRGYVAMSITDYAAALGHYHRVLDLARAAANYRLEHRALVKLAQLYEATQNYPEAERQLDQALRLVQSRPLADLTGTTYEQLSTLAGKRGQPAQALGFIRRALAAGLAAGDSASYYADLLNQGIIYKNLGQPGAAVLSQTRALAYFGRQHDAFGVAFTRANLARTQLLLGLPAPARQNASLALAWAIRTRNLDVRADVLDLLTSLAEQGGDFRRALALECQTRQVRDSLFNQQKNQQLLTTEARYQTQAKQARIEQLGQDNARQQRQLWGLVGGLALVLSLLGVAVWQYRVIRRADARSREQAARLATLLRELHHRVKNNLATVSSLLRLQTNRLTDSAALQAVRESRQRVDAMSLIHQRLYQTDEVTTVDMRAYLHDLADGLLRAYGHSAEAVDLELDVPEPAVDVDVAIPLGLIVNELTTNSLKHAYAQVARPRLRISLRRERAGLTLRVEDNGPGFDASAPAPRSFGRRLIGVLSEQLGGELTQRAGPGAGCELVMRGK